MSFLLYFQMGLTAVGSALVLAFAGPWACVAFAFGACLTFGNLAVLVFGWPRLLAQKQVARAVVAVVLKFAILGWILYLVAHSTLPLGWFALGLATVIPSTLVTAFNLPAETSAETSTET